MFKKILCLLLIALMFSITMNFGYSIDSIDAMPFSYYELSGQIQITSPAKNFTYADSDIVLNATLYIGGYEWEHGAHYIPYENISCVYSLDGAEWQNMSLVSITKKDPFQSVGNKRWWNNMWLYYTMLLQNVSEGSHYLKVDVKPDSIFTMSFHDEDEPSVYFNVTKQSSITELNQMPIVESILFIILAISFLIFVKKRN